MVNSRKRINVGDWIIFRSPTRFNNCKAVRKVKHVCQQTGRPEVGYNGWANFVVRREEVLAVFPHKPDKWEVAEH